MKQILWQEESWLWMGLSLQTRIVATAKDKESPCGFAGVYTAHGAVELYAEAFESMGAIDRLGAFFGFGVEHYDLKYNEKQITLVKKSWDVPKTYTFGEDTVTPLRGGERIFWKIVD